MKDVKLTLRIGDQELDLGEGVDGRFTWFSKEGPAVVLEDCAKCGEAPLPLVPVSVPLKSGTVAGYGVYCIDCKVMVVEETEYDALVAWNKKQG